MIIFLYDFSPITAAVTEELEQRKDIYLVVVGLDAASAVGFLYFMVAGTISLGRWRKSRRYLVPSLVRYQ